MEKVKLRKRKAVRQKIPMSKREKIEKNCLRLQMMILMPQAQEVVSLLSGVLQLVLVGRKKSDML